VDEGLCKTHLKNHVPLALAHVLVLELISGILCIVGCIGISKITVEYLVLWCSIFLYITYVAFWSTISKDYDGARTVVIYFIPAVMAVYWLN
jgi:hypothetical protein